MRKTGNGLKFATFVVTPGSVDFDSFVKGLEQSQASGQINIEEAFGWEPAILWPKTTWWHVTESLRGKGQPLKTIGETLGIREQMVSRVIQGAVKRGRIFYIYDVSRIASDIARHYLAWYAEFPDVCPVSPRLSAIVKEFSQTPSPVGLSRALAALLTSCPPEIADSLVKRLRPKFIKFPTKAIDAAKGLINDITGTASDGKDEHLGVSKLRIYLLSDDAEHIAQFHPMQVGSRKQFSEELAANIVIPMRQSKKGGVERRLHSGLYIYGGPIGEDPKEFWETSIKGEWEDSTPGYTIGYSSSTLEYHFIPRTPEVFAATVANMCGLLRWRDILIASLNKCSQCGGQGAWTCPHCNKVLCSNCWKADSTHGGLCHPLGEFGPPLTKRGFKESNWGQC